MTSIQRAVVEFSIAILLLLGVFFYGYRSGEVEEHTRNVTAQVILDKNTEDKYNIISQQLEEVKNARQDSTRTIVKKVDKIVTRTVYSNVCMDADGLQLINAALSGSISPTIPSAALQKAEHN